MTLFKDIITQAMQANIPGYGDVVAFKAKFDAVHTEHRTLLGFNSPFTTDDKLKVHMQEVYDVTSTGFSLFLNHPGIDALFKQWANDPALYAQTRFRNLCATHALNIARTRTQFVTGDEDDRESLRAIEADVKAGNVGCPVLAGRARLSRQGDDKMTPMEGNASMVLAPHFAQVPVMMGMLQYVHILFFENLEKEIKMRRRRASRPDRQKLDALKLIIRDLKHPQLVPISDKDFVQNNNFSSLVMGVLATIGRKIGTLDKVKEPVEMHEIFSEFFRQTVNGNLFASAKREDIVTRCPFHASFLKSLAHFSDRSSDRPEVDGLCWLHDRAKQHGHYAGTYFKFALSKFSKVYWPRWGRFVTGPQTYDNCYALPRTSRAIWRITYKAKRLAKAAFCPA